MVRFACSFPPLGYRPLDDEPLIPGPVLYAKTTAGALPQFTDLEVDLGSGPLRSRAGDVGGHAIRVRSSTDSQA